MKSVLQEFVSRWKLVSDRRSRPRELNQMRMEKMLVDEVQPDEKYDETGEEGGWIADESKRNGQP